MEFEADLMTVYKRLAAKAVKFLDERQRELPHKAEEPLFLREVENALPRA
jgi:hypothetical protein